uniref:Aurora kinase n=1 Tax=Panagrellus redivivus TaxID=6233 RepID=A0A7E4VY71_PANRE
MERSKLSVEDFAIGRKLGEGRFGTVFLCEMVKSNFVCAIKVVKKELLQENADHMLQTKREIELHRHMKHTNILRWFAYFYDHHKVYMVLEYAALGNLLKYTQSLENPMPEAQCAHVADSIAAALDYCHFRQVCHRDVKTVNILVAEGFGIKLADFGTAVHVPSSRMKTVFGTLDYLAPEMVDAETGPAYTVKVDNWSLGVVLYEILTLELPFYRESKCDTADAIRNCDMNTPKRELSADMLRIIKSLLTTDANDRLDLKDLQSDAWLTSQVATFAETLPPPPTATHRENPFLESM